MRPWSWYVRMLWRPCWSGPGSYLCHIWGPLLYCCTPPHLLPGLLCLCSDPLCESTHRASGTKWLTLSIFVQYKHFSVGYKGGGDLGGINPHPQPQKKIITLFGGIRMIWWYTEWETVPNMPYIAWENLWKSKISSGAGGPLDSFTVKYCFCKIVYPPPPHTLKSYIAPAFTLLS